MPNYKSANWINSLAELQALDMANSEDGVWLRTATESEVSTISWWDIGTTYSWWDYGTLINWFDIGTGELSSGPSPENWIGLTWRKDATTGIPATGGGYWIPSNNGSLTINVSGGSSGGITESAAIALFDTQFEERIPLDWNTQINGKPASYPPSSHGHIFSELTGVAAAVHNHTANSISDLTSWLSSQTIDVGQISGLSAAPVTSVNSSIGNVVLTFTDVGAAATVHDHPTTQITGIETYVNTLITDYYTAQIQISEIDYGQLINVPSILDELQIALTSGNPPAYPDVGFVIKGGSNNPQIYEGLHLFELENIINAGGGEGYLYFDGTNLTFKTTEEDDLLQAIAAMVSAAWEQIRESVTFGKIPSPNFIHLH